MHENMPVITVIIIKLKKGWYRLKRLLVIGLPSFFILLGGNMKIIAIDGPSGSGKGTIAKEVAKRLGFTYIDTGAMYRCVALKSIRDNVETKDEDKIVDLLKNMNIK